MSDQMTDIKFRIEGLRSGPDNLLGVPGSRIDLYMEGIDQPVYSWIVPLPGTWILMRSWQDETFERFLREITIEAILEDPAIINMIKAVRHERFHQVVPPERTVLFLPIDPDAPADTADWVLTSGVTSRAALSEV
jgi:hypothetical protein